MGCVILENMRNRGACKPEKIFFLFNTWPPIFSLFFKRIWIDLYKKLCLICEILRKIDKISLWTFWILHRLYRDLYLVVLYLLEMSRVWLNIQFPFKNALKWLRMTNKDQLWVFQSGWKGFWWKKWHFKVLGVSAGSFATWKPLHFAKFSFKLGK
jgi:hypothetical protein